MKFYFNKYLFLFSFLTISFGLFPSHTCLSQETFQLIGQVREIETDKTIVGANLFTSDSLYGTITDKNGNYILDIKEGAHVLIISHIAFQTKVEKIEIERSITKNYYLQNTIILKGLYNNSPV